MGNALADRYRIVESLGRRGTVDVHVAFDRFLEREVEIEVLDSSTSTSRLGVASFRRAAIALAAAESPHLLAVHDAGLDNIGVYLVLERAVGITLHDAIDRRGPMPAQRGIRLVQQVLTGLAAVHGAGLVHGDVTPANVVLTARERALLKPPPLLTSGDWPRDSVHLSSEAMRADLDDVLAILSFLITGREPRTGSTARSAVPPAVAALARERGGHAFTSATALRGALGRIATVLAARPS